MLVRYKRNKKIAFCYSGSLSAAGGEPQLIEKPSGPFESCGDCPYPSHRFMCYGSEGDCIRTDMQKLEKRRAENAQANPTA